MFYMGRKTEKIKITLYMSEIQKFGLEINMKGFMNILQPI